MKETAEIDSLNPLYPPVLGDFLNRGTPPGPRQEVSCTSFSAVSVIIAAVKVLLPATLPDVILNAIREWGLTITK
jgi:hypothetical protein